MPIHCISHNCHFIFFNPSPCVLPVSCSLFVTQTGFYTALSAFPFFTRIGNILGVKSELGLDNASNPKLFSIFQLTTTLAVITLVTQHDRFRGRRRGAHRGTVVLGSSLAPLPAVFGKSTLSIGHV